MSNYISDEYTYEIDALGYREQADKIRDMIINCETPFVIGISGRWGSGKTSLMKYIMASLGGRVQESWIGEHNEPLKDNEEEGKIKIVKERYPLDKNIIEHIHSIWFNPWEHENHDEPIIELLKEIRKYFSSISKTLKEGKKLLSVGLRAGLGKLAAMIQKEGDKFEHENFEYNTRSQRFKLIFQYTIEELLTVLSMDADETIKLTIDPRAKLVIFIDDLDRCEYATISKLLREIKQHLSTKRCVFVFGYDRHHVENALANTVQRSDKESRSYLEKLFQSTIYIKQPAEDKYKDFVMKRLGEYDFIPKGKCEGLCDFISDIIDPNPRRIKAFLTAFRFHVITSKLYKPSDTNPKPKIGLDDLQKLALITYLKIFHEPVYSVLESKIELVDDLKTVLKDNMRYSITNHNEYFFYLEMRSHLQDYDLLRLKSKEKDTTESDESSDDKPNENNSSKKGDSLEEMIKKEFLNNDEKSEKKFLTEVYEMQGKHKSYENFRHEFLSNFSHVTATDNYAEIKYYL
ncbi:MAG: hypothetical protein HQK96_10320 [Nitrospirae bacterium]|nr:hypothetical protein [Nitrospirota bacterium]